MSHYQVVARKYRPQRFSDVLGQEAIVTTLKHAIRMDRIAHAYLFCGSRGTGKTTLARLFAKILNCAQPIDDLEPCNACSSCKEIASGNSLDVLEIDGASHRGIEDIRQINETVGYASSCGKYKIYIIDEVHMLTKEAFNALLKTLEEPPPNVKFFFATTEPHKVLPTILSRCQRFSLRRIPEETIQEKLKFVASDMNVTIDDEALSLIAHVADGGLRDAESIFDQVASFSEGPVNRNAVSQMLGLMDRDSFFELDKAGKQGNLSAAFEIAEQVFAQGKDITHFIEGLVDHFRNLVLLQVSAGKRLFPLLSEDDFSQLKESAALYSKEQCLEILDFLVETQQSIRFAPSQRIALETVLLRILRSHQQIPVELLVRKLEELEGRIAQGSTEVAPAPPQEVIQAAVPTAAAEPAAAPTPPPPTPVGTLPEPAQLPAPAPVAKLPEPIQPAPPPPPTVKPPEPAAPQAPTGPTGADAIKQQSRYDTLFQFAAVELNGTLQKKR